MANKNKTSFTSNLFGKIRTKFTYPRTKSSELSDTPIPQLGTEFPSPTSAPYYSAELTNILFLSKRGLSRAPLAREVMRFLLQHSEYFGSIRPSARGISDAYEYCPFDKRMVQSARKFGYELSGNSRKVNMGELSSASLIVTLDRESENFTKSRKFYIRGDVKPIGLFLQSGNYPYIADPFERDNSSNLNHSYEEIIRSVEYGCGKIIKSLATLV